MGDLVHEMGLVDSQSSTAVAWRQGQILEAHVGLATRSAASVSLWESLQSKLVDSKGDYKTVAY